MSDWVLPTEGGSLAGTGRRYAVHYPNDSYRVLPPDTTRQAAYEFLKLSRAASEATLIVIAEPSHVEECIEPLEDRLEAGIKKLLVSEQWELADLFKEALDLVVSVSAASRPQD